MRNRIWTVIASGLTAAAVLYAGDVNAAKLKVVHSFCDEPCRDGLNPVNGLLRGAEGNFYGETTERGRFGHGTVFQLYRLAGKTKYKLRVLKDFCFGSLDGCKGGDGPGQGGHLIADAQGAVYGVAGSGGVFGGGTVFKLTPSDGNRWSLQVLYDFCAVNNCVDGNSPASLTYAGAAAGEPYDGVSPLYGLAEYGGENGKGIAFELSPEAHGKWRELVIYNFCSQSSCTDGANPAQDLLLDANGDLFGVTADEGGDTNPGVVFSLSPTGDGAWSETVLHTFCSSGNCSDGRGPMGGLVMDAAGNLLGITGFGGNTQCGAPSGCGVLYRISPNGEHSVLHTFCSETKCTDGALPLGRLEPDGAGNYFGTTLHGGSRGGGTIFRVDGDTYSVITNFCSGACGAGPTEPNDGVVVDSDGSFFGTSAGGNADAGVVYQLKP